MSEVLEAYRFQIEQQGFELEVDVAHDLPEVRPTRRPWARPC